MFSLPNLATRNNSPPLQTYPGQTSNQSAKVQGKQTLSKNHQQQTFREPQLQNLEKQPRH